MNCARCSYSNPADLLECEECGGLLAEIFTPPCGSPLASASEARADGLSGRLVPPTLLGNRYEVLELIGKGGMGFVYKVRDRELDKVIALKLIRSEQAGDPATVQRFKQELLLARKITHKNVVRIYDFGEADGLKFFTMEWIDGENLKQRIRSQGKIPVEDALPMIQRMLEALQEAHRQGVVHRDLKPQNTMVDCEGEPHILDFGIARAVDTNTMTATGAVLGTPDYMSPEQAQGEKADEQSDLFSFGVILYEMLTGVLPYQAESPLSRVVKRITQKPTAPRKLNVELPRYLDRIVLKCLEIDRELRYKSAGEILRDLEREQVDRSLTRKIRRAAGRRKANLAVASALVAAAGIALYFAGIRGSPLPGPEQEIPVTTLAILPFTNATGSAELEWMRAGLADMLITDISQSRFLRPVPGERVVKLLRELGVEEQSRFDEATLESVSKLAPAQSVLYGQFVESEGRIRLDLALRSAGSGVPTPIKVEGESDQVFTLVDKITRQIKEHLDLTPEQLRGDTDRPVASVSTASLKSLRAYQAGLAQIRQGANQNAISLLKEATEGDPSFVMAQAKLAEAYLSVGDYPEAEAAIDRAQSLSETAPLPLAARYQVHAIAALAKDDYETAVASYRELVSLYPEDPDIQLSLAQSLEEQGQIPEALEAYQRVVKLAPGYGAALLGLGRAHVISGQSHEAIRSLDQAILTKEFEDDPEAMGMIHSILGVAHRDSGQYRKAVEHLNLSFDFRRQTDDKRGQAVTLSNLAAVYEQRGQIEEALEAERNAVTLARDIGDRAVESMALLNMGLTYKATGDLDNALEAIRDSMRIEMDRQDSTDLAIRLDYIADIYRIRGQYDDTLVYLKQAKVHLAASGDEQERALNLNIYGVVNKSLGQYEEAIEALLAALPIFQEIQQPLGVATVQLDLAEIYSAQGRYADAYQLLQKSLEINQQLELGYDLAETITHWSLFLISVGQLEEAGKELGRAQDVAEKARADDLKPLILFARGKLLYLRGNLDEAAVVYQSANLEANRLSQKELAIRSQIERGRIHLRQSELAEAGQMLMKAWEEASQARLGVLEAEAATVLAELYLNQGEAETASETALQAIKMAKEFSGNPILIEAYATLGGAYQNLDRLEEAMDSYSEVAATLSRMRRRLTEEHIESFMSRSDIRALLEETAGAMKKAGRGQEAEALRKWIAAARNKPSSS